jgi:hypothetical protein
MDYCTVIYLYLLTHGAEPFLRSRQLCSHSRTYQHFMVPEGSLPCSQEPYNGPHPELYQSNPHHPILPKIYFNIVHPLTPWSSQWSLLAFPPAALYYKEDSWNLFLFKRLSRAQGHSAAGWIRSIEKYNEHIRNRTRDLPAYSTVPQPTTLHISLDFSGTGGLWYRPAVCVTP